MKGRRLISLMMAALLLLSLHVLAADGAEESWTRVEGEGDYVTIRIPYPEGDKLSWSQSRYLMVRYADTGEAAALSSEYIQGYLFVTVPAENAGRPFRVDQGEPLKFRDCIAVWRGDEYYDGPFGADQLNIRGIIRGDDLENLYPDQVITRAEAFTILCRLLSLKPDGDPGFADVSPEDWYYETASAAKAAGLTAETEYFAPTRPVTRGEITLMLYRAMKTIGWMEETVGSREALPVADAEAIPAWALSAYTAFGQWNLGMFTYQDTGEIDEFGVPVQEPLAQQGVGADILFISTKPTEDTLAKAAAAGVELELIPIAHDAMVFFTNSENSMENLTMEQIRSIYVDNAYDNWKELGGPDAGLIPYCRNADSGSQAQMEEFFLHGDEIHPDIRRETTSISMASVLTDVQDAGTDDPLAYALGYSIYYYYHISGPLLLYPEDSLKLLSVEGIYPTDETIADGTYPLAGYNYAVVRADEPEHSLARRMVEFMLSKQGQQCVVNAGFGALE